MKPSIQKASALPNVPPLQPLHPIPLRDHPVGTARELPELPVLPAVGRDELLLVEEPRISREARVALGDEAVDPTRVLELVRREALRRGKIRLFLRNFRVSGPFFLWEVGYGRFSRVLVPCCLGLVPLAMRVEGVEDLIQPLIGGLSIFGLLLAVHGR